MEKLSQLQNLITFLKHISLKRKEEGAHALSLPNQTENNIRFIIILCLRSNLAKIKLTIVTNLIKKST